MKQETKFIIAAVLTSILGASIWYLGLVYIPKITMAVLALIVSAIFVIIINGERKR
jgi:drug/metabolite transporter (DMT)-like permease